MPSQSTTEKAKPILEKPKPKSPSDDQRQIDQITRGGVTIDAAVRELLVKDHCLANTILWNYVFPNRAGRDPLAEITIAANGTPIQGIHRRRPTISGQVEVFWNLHSKYRAPTLKRVRGLYKVILGVVNELFEAFGMEKRAIETLSNKMAEYSGEMGEESANVDRFAPIYLGIMKNYNFQIKQVIESFLNQNGSIPRNPEMDDRVNVERNLHYHFSEDSLLAMCIRLISTVIAQQKRAGKLDELIKWDFERTKVSEQKGGRVSIFFLGMPCSCEFGHPSEPSADFFGDKRLQQLMKQPDDPAHLELTKLFTYSNLGAYLEEAMHGQEEKMQGVDKTSDSYTAVSAAVRGEAWPPWVYKGGWPRDATVEDANFARCLEVINSVKLVARKKRPRDEPNLRTEVAEEPRNYSALKALLNDPGDDVPAKRHKPEPINVDMVKEEYLSGSQENPVDLTAEDPDGENPAPSLEKKEGWNSLFIFLGALILFGGIVYVMR
jgi:hypothetical protein